jgi:hypothetical protein
MKMCGALGDGGEGYFKAVKVPLMSHNANQVSVKEHGLKCDWPHTKPSNVKASFH